MNKPIGWGKCSVLVKNLSVDGAKWTKMPTPKEDSTTLTATKGDKKEASIEGGGNEDVRYAKSTYELAYAIRRNTVRVPIIKAVDGLVSDRYAVFVQPENIAVPGPCIEETVVTLEDNFDTTDGGLFTYTHDGILPDDGTATVKWMVSTLDLSTIAEGAEVEDSALSLVDFDAETDDSGN
ncbi:MAG: hypothetical protein LUC22_03015 [Prevotella sp.]|nr:hypothetical protein [Prevotella sp.]